MTPILQTYCHVDPECIADVLKHFCNLIDSNSNSKIEYNEFLAAAIKEEVQQFISMFSVVGQVLNE